MMPPLSLTTETVPGRAAARPAWVREVGATCGLAAPLVLTNLAQHAVVTADVVLLGRLGAEPLAAATLASSLYFILFIAGLGFTGAVAPLIAAARGASGAADEANRHVRAGVWAATLVALPLMAGLWHTGALLRLIGEPAALAEGAGRYMRALQWGMWPALVFMVLRGALAALGRPGWALGASLTALPVNVVLALWLGFDGPGCLGLGATGVGIATSLSAFAALGLLCLALLLDRRLAPHRLLHGLWRFERVRLAAILRLGGPMAATGFAEAGLFEAAALAIGLFGAGQLAAHAVAIQVAAICFMVPNGIAQAATVRVGLAYGAGSRPAMRRAARVALALALAFMTLCALVQTLVPERLIGLFLDVDAPANAAATAFGVSFLGFAALFAIADGIQSVCLGVLRGVQDTRVPMVIAVGGYWGIGVPLGLWLAFRMSLEGRGVWLGFCAGLFVVAGLLLARWARLSRT